MARKRTSETEIAVSQNAAAAASARRKTASPRKKHAPAASVAEPLAVPSDSNIAVAATAYQPTHDDVAALAYSYWVARGYQGGSPEEDWLRAERELGLAAAAVNA